MSEQNRDAAYIASLSTVIDMQKRLVLILDGLQNRGTETMQALERVSRRLTKLHEDQIGIAAEVGSIRQEIGGVRQEIGRVKQEIGGVRQDIGDLRQDLHLFRTEVAGRFEAVGRLLPPNSSSP